MSVPPAVSADTLAVDTHCPYCALQCAMRLTANPATRSVEVQPRDFPTNGGGLCQKGWTSAEVLTVPDRLTEPLVRGDDGALHAATWDAALTRITETIRSTWSTDGRDAIAVFGGGGLTNEKAYSLGKFTRAVLRTANIDYNGRFCMSSAAAAANRSLGADRGLPFPLADLGGADAILLLGSNIAETMPPALRHLAGVRSRGGLIVSDPRRSATAGLADNDSGLHLQPVPGTDLVLLSAILHVVFAEGLEDLQYLDDRTTGADDVRRSVAAWWPERAEQECGVGAVDIRRAARLLALASTSHGGAGAFILTGRGVEQSTQGTATVTAAINLALALGLPGRQGSGYGAITGQGNGQGGREHGQKADQLPGYRSISDPAARAHVAGVWGMSPADLPGPGLPAVQLLDRLGQLGGPRVLLVHGSNLSVSSPNASKVIERLRSLDLLVVSDFVLSETAALADVVLPVTQWAEEAGTMTSLEGRVLRRRQALPPPAGVRSELDVFADIAERLGSPVRMASDPAEVFDELARASRGGIADYGGLSHELLDTEEPFFWPAIEGSAGTPRLFTDGFPMPAGRARMLPVDHVGPADDLRPDAPLYLVTGRVLQHYQSGAQTRRVAELDRAVPEAFAQVHPLLGERLGLQDGDKVRLTTTRGSITVPAQHSDRIRPDTVFVPFHWGGAQSVNLLTTDAVDPISSMPEFKVCAVDVQRAVENGVPSVIVPAPAVTG